MGDDTHAKATANLANSREWVQEKPLTAVVSPLVWMLGLLLAKVASKGKAEGKPFLVQEAWSEHPYPQLREWYVR